MKKRIITRGFFIFVIIISLANNAIAQVDNSTIYFYRDSVLKATYIVKFDYSKRAAYKSYESNYSIMQNLEKSTDYYENEIWSADAKISNRRWDKKYDYDKESNTYYWTEEVYEYDDKCIYCQELNGFFMTIGSECCTGCGSHGYHLGDYEAIWFSSDMSEMNILRGNLETDTQDPVKTLKRCRKEDFKPLSPPTEDKTYLFPTNFHLYTREGDTIDSSITLGNGIPTIILIHAYWASPSQKILEMIGENCTKWEEYGTKIIVIEITEKERRKYYDIKSPCFSLYYDDDHIFWGSVPRLYLFNKKMELVYSKVGYVRDDREKVIAEITKKLQEIQ